MGTVRPRFTFLVVLLWLILALSMAVDAEAQEITITEQVAQTYSLPYTCNLTADRCFVPLSRKTGILLIEYNGRVLRYYIGGFGG